MILLLYPEFALCSHAQPSPGLALHRHQPSTAVRAGCLSFHYPSLRRCWSPLPLPPLLVPPSEPIAATIEPWSTLCVRAIHFCCPVLPLPRDWTTDMVRTRGGHRYRPRVRFSTPEMEDPGTSGAAGAHSPDLPAVTQPALVHAAIPEEPQGFRRYQTRMGPRAPSLVGPNIRPGGVFEISARAVTSPR